MRDLTEIVQIIPIHPKQTIWARFKGYDKNTNDFKIKVVCLALVKHVDESGYRFTSVEGLTNSEYEFAIASEDSNFSCFEVEGELVEINNKPMAVGGAC